MRDCMSASTFIGVSSNQGMPVLATRFPVARDSLFPSRVHATKAYVLLLGEALHHELEPHGVAVTALCPGPAATSFGEVAGARNSPILKLMSMEPQAVAEAGVHAM